MSTQTFENPQDTQAVWPDGLPAVSVDIETGRKFASVNIDPFELASLMDEMLVPLESRSKMSLLLSERLPEKGKTKERSKDYYFTSADYDEKTDEVRVRLHPWRADADMNRSLTHETQHFSDNIQGKLETKTELFVRKFIRRVKAIGMTAVPSSSLIAFTALHFGTDTLLSKAVVATELLASGVGVHTAVGRANASEYQSRPSEMRAFSAEANPHFLHNTITATKR